MANWWEYFEHGWGNPFGVHGPAYNPQIGHRGTDHPAPAHSSLPAWETMTVVENASHPIVGNVVNLRAHSDGAYLGVAHALMVRVQHGLRNHGWYHGPLDGHGGENTGKGIQLALAHDHLYSGPIDGKLGPAGAKGVQQFGHKHGGYTGPVDGDPREHSWTAFAHALGG